MKTTYVKCKKRFTYQSNSYYTVGNVYIVKQANFNQNAYIVGGTCLLKPDEIKKHFDEVDENDNNKILCIKDYYHNSHRHYTAEFDYYVHEIDWEREYVLMSSNKHEKIGTPLNVIKEHFDLTHILRKKKIEKILK